MLGNLLGLGFDRLDQSEQRNSCPDLLKLVFGRSELDGLDLVGKLLLEILHRPWAGFEDCATHHERGWLLGEYAKSHEQDGCKG